MGKLDFIIFIFFMLTSINNQDCISDMYIEENECFNEIITINLEDKNYRAGHFALNKNGDMIVEYSSEEYRLFYGLKKDGKYFFPNINKEIEIKSDEISSNLIRRYESINSFVSLFDDFNKEQEFLLSISANLSILELYNLENDEYSIQESTLFFDKSNGLYSHIFQILEAKINNKNIYFCVYIYNKSKTGRYIAIRRFGLASFNSYDIISSDETTYQDNYGTRIVSSIIINDYIIIFFMHSNEYYYIYFYDFDLSLKGTQELGPFSDGNLGTGIFFKACNLKDNYLAFLYFGNSNNFNFNIFQFFPEKSSNYFEIVLGYSDSSISFYNDITTNDFIKIYDDRLAFFSVARTTNNNELYILLFDLYQSYTDMAVRYYKYNLNDKVFQNDFSAFLFNGFLVFSSTIRNADSIEDNYYSILLMFGYPNGTDFEIDISPYFADIEGYSNENNLYNFLIEKMKIDNNIFGYEKVEEIKIISMPEEIIINNTKDNILIANNDNININCELLQNQNIIKEDKYYYLNYQYIAKEPNFNTFYTIYTETYKKYDSSTNVASFFEPKIFYGRVNTLKFKLCHNYCKTCLRFGISDNEQNCQSCLEKYTYSHIEHQNSECIPENYFYDLENKELTPCNSTNSKFYTILSNNKTICIKKDYACPNDYSYLNETTNECLKYFPSEIPTNNPESSESETQINKNSDNVNNSKLIDFNGYINNKIISELLEKYNAWNESIEIKGEGNLLFQLTTTINELNILYGKNSSKGYSLIDLGECEAVLKSEYQINESISLIIKKVEQLAISAERNIQFEVYHPTSKIKLNLSYCRTESINLYIPVELNEKLKKLYIDLQKSGYDLFNIEDPFYNDICSPYKSENGTDVLLSDRKNDYYDNNYTTCQSNCHYSSYDLKYQFLKCECRIIVDEIDIYNFNKFSQAIYKNFFDVLQNSNYKVMKCYKLVFNIAYFKRNIGNFLVMAFFGVYIIFLIIYIIKGITPIKKEIMKIISNKFNNVKINNLENSSEFKKDDKNNFPPKKKKAIKKYNDISLTRILNSKKNKSNKIKTDKSNNKIILNKFDNSLENNDNNLKSNISNTNKNILDLLEKNKISKKEKLKDQLNINKNNKYINLNNLEDLELNNLSYKKALIFDKRTIFQIYWSKLKKKHLLIFTFLSQNDHNLIYIKIDRFLFLISTTMAMNIIFFFDSSMHKIYLDYGKYNFIGQIPQILYSSLLSLLIEFLINFLGYTDINIYQIMKMKKYDLEQVKSVLKRIKIKLLTFFLLTFLFFSFYWYLISAFCAVYNNTQIIFLKDFISSFCVGLLYPFAVQFCFASLRIISLKKKSNIRGLLYKIC